MWSVYDKDHMSNKESYIINKNSEIKSQLCHFLLIKKIRYLYIGTRTLRTSWTELVGTLPPFKYWILFSEKSFFFHGISVWIHSLQPFYGGLLTNAGYFPVSQCGVHYWCWREAPSVASFWSSRSREAPSVVPMHVARALYWHPVAWTSCGVGAFESIFIYGVFSRDVIKI